MVPRPDLKDRIALPTTARRMWCYLMAASRQAFRSSRKNTFTRFAANWFGGLVSEVDQSWRVMSVHVLKLSKEPRIRPGLSFMLGPCGSPCDPAFPTNGIGLANAVSRICEVLKATCDFSWIVRSRGGRETWGRSAACPRPPGGGHVRNDRWSL